jgi:hypothetical protein
MYALSGGTDTAVLGHGDENLKLNQIQVILQT